MLARCRSLALCILALALVLAGCSGGGGGTAQQSASSATTKVVEPTRTVTATGSAESSVSAETTIPANAKATVYDTVKDASATATFAELLAVAGMDKSLQSTKRYYTLFAPTEGAFAKLPASWLPALRDPANKEKLRVLLRYHLVKATIDSYMMFNIRRLMTYQGGILKISEKKSVGYINGTVMITQGDVRAKNGVVHVIDTVLVPPGFKL